jgi:archaellum component FlaF (FlaF/FlaG flagellin family)
MKHTLLRRFSAATLLISAAFIIAGPVFSRVYADPAPLQQAENTVQASTSDPCKDTTGTNGLVSQTKVSKCLDQSPIVHDIQNIVNFLSAAVGVVVIGVIVLGGIQYSLAGDNATALTAARKRITNGLIALFAFLFAWACLQWLIPGGIFG